MLVTFDSNNIKINNNFDTNRPIIQTKLWCECKINNDISEYCCEKLSESTFESGNYFYCQTPISYMSQINNIFPNFKKNVHIICLDFTEGLFYNENKILTQNILNNIDSLKGYVIIITNNYEKIQQISKKDHMTYVYAKKNLSEKLICNFVSIFVHFVFLLKKMFVPEDLIELWKNPKFNNFKPLSQKMELDLELFAIYNQNNNQVKKNCTINKLLN